MSRSYFNFFRNRPSAITLTDVNEGNAVKDRVGRPDRTRPRPSLSAKNNRREYPAAVEPAGEAEAAAGGDGILFYRSAGAGPVPGQAVIFSTRMAQALYSAVWETGSKTGLVSQLALPSRKWKAIQTMPG